MLVTDTRRLIVSTNSTPALMTCSLQDWNFNNQDGHHHPGEFVPFVVRPPCSLSFPTLYPQGNSFAVYPNCALARLLPLENQFYSNISPLLSVDSASDGKVDAVMRDESLTRLLSLHRAYYDLSPAIFCKTVCLVDSFITRVKVKPKYMMCVATACYYISSKFETVKVRPTIDSLVRLARCGGSIADLVRMVDIVLTKLGAETVTAIGATSATTLDFLSAFLSDAALALLLSYKRNPPLVSVSDSESLAFSTLQSIGLDEFFSLANFCNVNWADVEVCSRTLLSNGTLESYSPSKSPVSVVEVVWNLSKRTRLNLSGSAAPSLKTIAEWTEEEEQ